MIVSKIVGVKLPDSGIGTGVDEKVGVGEAVGLIVGVDVGFDVAVGANVDEAVEVGLGVSDPEGLDSKAGPSAA